MSKEDTFCSQLLEDRTCQILNEKCFRQGIATQCDFIEHYELLKKKSSDPPIVNQIKTDLMNPVIQEWKKYAQMPSPGKKGMTGIPFEKVVRTTVDRYLSPLGINVEQTGKKYPCWRNVDIIVDCLIRKGGYPDCIISVKSWIAAGQIRETYAFAYFVKTWHGQKNIRVYMLGFYPIQPYLQSLVQICKPYIDGVYSLTGEPYVDDLVTELQEVYS